MTILEAMASHLPLIVTNVGGVGKVIKNEENGICLQPGDPDALAGAIMELAGDEQKRKRFAQKAYQDVCEHFSDKRMAGQYQQIYTDIMST
jgi:glycosyltransferase involved in cell wall biosynthesis